MGETEGENPIHTSVAPKFVILIARLTIVAHLNECGGRGHVHLPGLPGRAA